MNFFSLFKKKRAPAMTVFELVPPHRTVSRKVGLSDYQRVTDDAYRMAMWMVAHDSCVGLAHAQFEDKDPLRFFVTAKEVVINPVILRHSNYSVSGREGCMTYPGRAYLPKKRFQKMDVEYETFNEAGEHEKKSRTVTGLEARIFQHEMDHLDGKYCYD